MNRIEAEEYLVANYSELIAAAGLHTVEAALDNFDGFLATRPEVDPVWHARMASYYLLVRLQAAFAPGMDVSIDRRGSFTRSQRFKQVTELLNAVRAQLVGIIDPVPPVDEGADFGVVTVHSHYLTGGAW